jgi:hypothetical protein
MSNEPRLANSSTLDKNAIGTLQFDTNHPQVSKHLKVSDDKHTVEWEKSLTVAWLQAPTTAKLHSGKYTFDFVVENMASRQIGVGFLLDWERLGRHTRPHSTTVQTCVKVNVIV